MTVHCGLVGDAPPSAGGWLAGAGGGVRRGGCIGGRGPPAEGERAPGGYVCIYVYGSADYVNQVRAVRGKNNLICNWQAAMYVNNSSGRRIETRWSPVQNRCDAGRAWYDFWPRKIYPDHSRVCVSWYESGVKQGGSPCETLHR